MKLKRTPSFGLFVVKDFINEKLDWLNYKDRSNFLKTLNSKWKERAEELNAIVTRINDWSIRVKDSINRINLRYQHQGTVLDITITIPDTDTVVAHGLKYVPSFFLVIDSEIEGYICKGATEWDSSNCTFKAGTIGSFTAVVW